MKRLPAALVLLAVSGSSLALVRPTSATAPPACKVQGVWERVATIQAGKRTEFTGARQVKVVTRKHFMWLTTASRRDTLPLRTALDSARFFETAGGYGTYQALGSKHTENIDLFVDPRLQAKSLKASCRIDGNRWYHTYLASAFDEPTATSSATDSITEVWRRVE